MWVEAKNEIAEVLPLNALRARVLIPLCDKRFPVFDPDSLMRQKCAALLSATPMPRLPECPEDSEETFVIVACLVQFDHAMLRGDLPFEVTIYGHDYSI